MGTGRLPEHAGVERGLAGWVVRRPGLLQDARDPRRVLAGARALRRRVPGEGWALGLVR